MYESLIHFSCGVITFSQAVLELVYEGHAREYAHNTPK
jgi:hypothetical protein